MVSSYEDLMGEPMDPADHNAYSKPDATQRYAGDVQPLHPAGTFARNTQSGDIINGMAKDLGVSNPPNVLKFQKKQK